MKPLFLEKEAAAEAVALSVSSMERMVREGTFPPPRSLSGRRVGWLVRELEAWADGRPVSDQAPPPNTAHANRRRAGEANPG